MMREDMGDYFTRLRTAPAQLPAPPVAAVAGPPPAQQHALGPIRNNGLQERRKKQTSISEFV